MDGRALNIYVDILLSDGFNRVVLFRFLVVSHIFDTRNFEDFGSIGQIGRSTVNDCAILELATTFSSIFNKVLISTYFIV